MNNNYYIIVGIIIALWLFLIFYTNFEGFENNLINSNENKIPKIIWTYWDSDDLPEIVIKCINTWKKYNPNYKIIILNKNNTEKYLPNVDFTKMKNIHDSEARYSDMVRLHILSKYGGIWSDASIICMEPFDNWILNMQKKTDAEFIGFYIDLFTSPNYKNISPVIESWFFACKPECNMVKDWLQEFKKITDFNSIEDYINNIKKEGIDLQKINNPIYLTIHASCQKILQKGKNKPYNFQVLKADDTAFKYLTSVDWDSKKAIENIIKCKTNNNCVYTPIIKLRKPERNQLENMNYSVLFE